MDKYLDSLLGKSKILDLTKDNADFLISEFNILLKQGNLVEIYKRLESKKDDCSVMNCIFDKIEKEEAGVIIRCKRELPKKIVEIVGAPLNYDSYPKFAILRERPIKECFNPNGIYVSYCTPNPIGPGAMFGWGKEINPNRRMECFFIKYELKPPFD